MPKEVDPPVPRGGTRDKYLDRAGAVLLLLVGVALFVLPEPATSVIGGMAVVVGVVGLLVA